MMLRSALLSLVLNLIFDEANASDKRGVVFGRGTYTCGDLDILNGVHWFHNQGSSGNMGCGRLEPNFVPMLWDDGFRRPPNLHSHPVVLGFNAPNDPDQANMSPQQAARSWIRIQNAYLNKTLVAPSVRPQGRNMSPTAWLDQFFDECIQLGGCRVDAIATHLYSGNVDQDMHYLRDLHNRYHKKIWLTEFAVPNTDDIAKVWNYMRQMLPQLEEADFVEQYAWYTAKWYRVEGVVGDESKQGWYLSSANSLFVPGTSRLSALGRFYNRYIYYSGKSH